MEAELNSTPTTPTAWHGQAVGALIAAQSMSEVAQCVLSRLIDEHETGNLDLATYCHLQAVLACLMRLDAAIEPAIEAAPPVAVSQ